jgi:hypothetical protein
LPTIAASYSTSSRVVTWCIGFQGLVYHCPRSHDSLRKSSRTSLGTPVRNLLSVSALTSPVAACLNAHTTPVLLCGRSFHFRHPAELGGIYFFVNALKNVASWFVAAALYSRFFVAGTTELGLVAGMNASAANYSGFLNSTGANFTGAINTGAIAAFVPAFQGISSHASATATGAIMHASKIGDLPLFATVGVLTAVWLIAVAGLPLTIKCEYLYTFVSLQTGYSFSQSYFLDNQSNDAKRITIFFCNERQWQAIRDRVRQWVLSVYAAWQALMPAFFTADLQARIPDDFIPAQAVQDLDAQSRDGRRPTVQNMGLLRRVSHASPIDAASESDSGARRPSHLPSQDPMEPTATAAIMRHAANVAARPCNMEVGPAVSLAEIARGSYRDDPLVKPHGRPDAADEDDEHQMLPEELPCEEVPA